MGEPTFGHRMSEFGHDQCISVYDIRFQVVDIAIGSGAPTDLGAARWGTGSEFGADNTGELRAMTLDVAPYEIVDPLPPDEFDHIAEAVTARAAPGRIRLTDEHAVVTADAVWLGQPFGRAIWSFQMLPVDPADALLERLSDMDFVEVCSGIVIGLGDRGSDLSLVYTADFAETQRLPDGEIVSTTDEPALISLLRRINYYYFADPDFDIGAPNPVERFLLDPGVPRRARDIINLLIEQLNTLTDRSDDG